MLKWNTQYQQHNNDKGMMWWRMGHGGVITFHGIIHAPIPLRIICPTIKINPLPNILRTPISFTQSNFSLCRK